MTGRGLFFRDWAALLTLVGIGIAQPLYSLLGQNLEFFVAHGVGRWGLLALTLALSFGIATILALAGAGLGLISNRLRTLGMALTAGLLIGLFVLPLIARLDVLPPWIAIGLAVAIALGAALFVQQIRSFAAFAAPIALVFPLLFLFFTPAFGMLFPQAREARVAQEIQNPAPIVMIVLDEFNPLVLLDDEGQIDAVRFPHFAQLAADATWFPNATSIHNQTHRAVPAMLTGNYPPSAETLPTLAGHPNNLFTWLGGAYRVNAWEPMTLLCPAETCPNRQTAPEIDVLAADTAIVYLHTLLPAELSRQWLPPIDAGWGQFAAAGGHDHAAEGKDDGRIGITAAQRKEIRQRFAVASEAGRANTFEEFVTSVDASDGVLNFLHILLPHQLWEYTPSGQRYMASPSRMEMTKKGEWRNQPSADFSFNRFMLQVGFVDAMLGRLMDKLKSEQRYDETLLVVVADHGVSFLPGDRPREISERNAAQILRVPMFVKAPGQEEGAADERNASILDILPTIADAVDAEVPWDVAGASLLAETFPERTHVEARGIGKSFETMTFPLDEILSDNQLQWQLSTFGSGVPLGSTTIRRRYPELIGRSPDNVAEGAALPGVEVNIKNGALLEDVQLDGLLPLLVRGTLFGAGTSGLSDLPVAVVLNGKIVATLETFALDETNELHFVGVLPQDGLVEGENTLDISAIDETSGAIQLRPFGAGGEGGFMVVESETEEEPTTIVSADGSQFPLRDTTSAEAYLRLAQSKNGRWNVAGWAIDVLAKAPSAGVLVFDNGELIHSFQPYNESQAASERFKLDKAYKSGFRSALPADLVDWDSGDLRVFVLGADYARELRRCEKGGTWGTWC